MVGILTFHTQYNCGSALQTYAMQEAVRKLGYGSVFLNYYYEKDMAIYDIRWKSGPKVFGYDLLTAWNTERKKKAFREFALQHFDMTEQTRDWRELGKLSQGCSTLLCGSDQIWNLSIVEGVNPAYFLKFASENQRCVSYAPSIANERVLASIEQYRTELKEALQRFDAVSVREKTFTKPLSEIAERDVVDVLDPTLLHTAETYDALLQDYHLKLPEKYLFIYCIHGSSFGSLRRMAEKIAREKNLKIVYCSKFNIHRSPFALNIYPYDARAFVLAIKNAELVISDSFHAGVFSIIYRKQFGTTALGCGNSRMRDLFHKLGIGDRLVEDGSFPAEEIDYDLVYARWEQEKERSYTFLKNALQEGEDGE